MPPSVTRRVLKSRLLRKLVRSRLPCSVPLRDKFGHFAAEVRGRQVPQLFEHAFFVVTLESSKREMPQALRRGEHSIYVLDGGLVRRKLRVFAHGFPDQDTVTARPKAARVEVIP